MTNGGAYGAESEPTASPSFQPELHSWILIPESPTSYSNASHSFTNDDYYGATAASEEASDTSCVTAQSMILARDEKGEAATSPVLSPALSVGELATSTELLNPTWPLALPRPWLGSSIQSPSPDAESSDYDTTDSSVTDSAVEADSPGHLIGWGRPLAFFAALLASHVGVLLLGMYLGSKQHEHAYFARRFSSGASGYHSRLCMA